MTRPYSSKGDNEGDLDDQSRLVLEGQAQEEEKLMAAQNPAVDLSGIRGIKEPNHAKEEDRNLRPAPRRASGNSPRRGGSKRRDGSEEEDLQNLAELLPELQSKQESKDAVDTFGTLKTPPTKRAEHPGRDNPALWSMKPGFEPRGINPNDSMAVEDDNLGKVAAPAAGNVKAPGELKEIDKDDMSSESSSSESEAIPDPRLKRSHKVKGGEISREPSMPGGMMNADGVFNMSSGASLSTATQTHEVRMPMYLPTFKPATGCTNASDFIVRCFVARLRSGITVVKHGRSRWCKSRLRILHVHSDGRSLSWKPALGEPSSSKRPPKLDLSTCTEVRHAWSPDPLNPMFTGTPILRQKCEAANAHKSFALIFPKRTVDITAITADQCKVLMEGFSALCFRLQVANLAGRGRQQAEGGAKDYRETVSVTLSNQSSTNKNPTSEEIKKRR